MKERHDINELDLETPNRNFFTNNFIVDVFVFTIAIILVIITMIILYVLCKYNKLKTLVVNLALQQVKEVSTSTKKKEEDNYMCDCTSQFYIILALSITIIALVRYMSHKVSFLNDQNKFNLYTSFCQVIYSGFLRCEGKCSSQQKVGIELGNFILNEIIY